MKCPHCGKDVPEGSVICPSCGNGVIEDDEIGEISTIQTDIDSDSEPEAKTKKKSKSKKKSDKPANPKKKWLIISLAVVAVIIIAAVVTFLIYYFGSKNGKYYCDDYESMGIQFYLEINGEDCDVVSAYDADGDGSISTVEKEVQEAAITFDGTSGVLSLNGEDTPFTYDRMKKTISMTDDLLDVTLVFTRRK